MKSFSHAAYTVAGILDLSLVTGPETFWKHLEPRMQTQLVLLILHVRGCATHRRAASHSHGLRAARPGCASGAQWHEEGRHLDPCHAAQAQAKGQLIHSQTESDRPL